jgi:hypothetical protein
MYSQSFTPSLPAAWPQGTLTLSPPLHSDVLSCRAMGLFIIASPQTRRAFELRLNDWHEKTRNSLTFASLRSGTTSMPSHSQAINAIKQLENASGIVSWPK